MNPFSAELIGTMVLIVLGHSVNANLSLKGTLGENAGWLVMSIGWGVSVFCAVTVAGPISGAHINPAVTLGLAVAGLFPWDQVPLFIVAQLLGAGLGAFIVWLNFRKHFDATDCEKTKLGVFSTGPAIKHYPRNFVCELTGTFILMFVILYISGPELVMKQNTVTKIGLGSIGALPVAFLVMAIGMGLGGTTGYAINPARDLAPRVMHAILPIKAKGTSNWKYAWIPIVAPLTGATIASAFYLIIS